jgi:hypothetical protein
MAATPRTRSRTRRHAGVASLMVGAILVGLSLIPIALTIQVSASRPLSQLETTLFASVTYFFSIIGSALISSYYARGQSRKDYIQLARPALRRVIALSRSAVQIADAVQSKQAALQNNVPPDPMIVREWLESIERLLQQHSGQLEAAISDWQELLPEEYAEIMTLAGIQAQIDDRIDTIVALRAEQSDQSNLDIARLTEEVNELRRRLEREQTESSFTPFTHVPSERYDAFVASPEIVIGRQFSTGIDLPPEAGSPDER